jgi:hypothetical protein
MKNAFGSHMPTWLPWKYVHFPCGHIAKLAPALICPPLLPKLAIHAAVACARASLALGAGAAPVATTSTAHGAPLHHRIMFLIK